MRTLSHASQPVFIDMVMRMQWSVYLTFAEVANEHYGSSLGETHDGEGASWAQKLYRNLNVRERVSRHSRKTIMSPYTQ